jgi:hypothetical protein
MSHFIPEFYQMSLKQMLLDQMAWKQMLYAEMRIRIKVI